MSGVLASHIEEIDYFFERLSQDYVAGFHPSAVSGCGFHIKGYDNVFNRSDFPSVDWTATIVSGSRMPLVKILEQKSAITVLVLSDVTASVDFSGSVRKKQEMAKLIACLGFSAYKLGDRFGLIAYGDRIYEFFEPLSSRGYALETAEWLWHLKPSASNNKGVLDALDLLPKKPVLIFWLSDFNLEADLAEKFLTECNGHQIVPIVFWDSAEFDRVPDWGLAWLKDPETGETRPELLWPGRRKEFKTAFENRRLKLESLFKDFGIEPIFVLDELKPSQIAEFFLKRRL